MITEYSLTNFKAFAGRQNIKLKPITLIYGQNSSGKSSILQSLLMLKQTIELSENPETLLLPKGNLVDLGGFREFINSHDVQKIFAFELRLSLSKSNQFFPGIVSKAIESLGTKTAGLKFEMVYDSNSSSANLHTLSLYLGDCPEPLFLFKAERTKVKEFYSSRFSFGRHRSSSDEKQSILRLANLNEYHPIWDHLFKSVQVALKQEGLKFITHNREILSRELVRYQRLELKGIKETKKRPKELKLEKQLQEIDSILEKSKNFSKNTFLQELQKQSSKTLILCRNFLPVSVMREEKDESKDMLGLLEDIGGFGYDLVSMIGLTMYAANDIQNALESTIYIGPLRDYPERHYIFSGNLTEHVGKSGKMVSDVLFKRKDLLEKVNEQLEAFGLNYELKVSSVNDSDSDLQDVFALRFFDKKTKIHASILDVGFGISQLLPIIVQSMLSKRKILCIEQPEIHLHPKLQADLGTLISNCIKEPLSNRFIIETHSQHLILRLQKLIRQKELTPEDVSVIYVNRTSDGSQCIDLRLDKDGDFIDRWPHGFFEEGYNEMFT